MLGKREYQLAFRLDHLNRLIGRQFFSLIRMNAAYKCAQTHLTNLLSIKFQYVKIFVFLVIDIVPFPHKNCYTFKRKEIYSRC